MMTAGGGATATAPQWLDGMPLDAFSALADTNYSTWAASGIATISPFYRGSNPRGAIVDAYCDPAFDPSTGCFYLWGGGHGDGTCNALIEFDARTKVYRIVSAATPPSVYLPLYATTTDRIDYPSGKYFAGGAFAESPKLPPANEGGFFLTVAQGLNATTDAGYIAPAMAKISTHSYAAMAVRGREVHFFCTPSYAVCNIDTGVWSGYGVDIGMQLYALQANLTNLPFSHGNAAVYDATTDRFIVTLQPGDFAAGNRNGVLVFDPGTKTVESFHNQTGYLGPSPSMVLAGRKVYLFRKVGNYLDPQNMNQGSIFDIDSQSFSYFTIQSDPAGTVYSQTLNQETIPAWYDTERGTIVRWNYEDAKGGNVHEVSLTPLSGAGTSGSPYVLQQTVKAVSGAPTGVKYRYRGHYWPAADAMLILPHAGADWRVLRLA